MKNRTESAPNRCDRALRACLMAMGLILSLAGVTRAEALTPTSADRMAREALGAKLPAAKVLWSRGGQIYFSTIKDWSPRRVVVSGTMPRWSPDGTKIAYLQRASAWVMNADFSDKTEMIPDVVVGSWPALDWTADGKAITAIKSDGYRVVKCELATGRTTTIYDTRQPPYNGGKLIEACGLHPSGRYLLTFQVDPDHATLIVDLQEKKYIANNRMLSGDCVPAWSPDGSYIVNTLRKSSRPVMRADFDPQTGTIGDSNYFIGLDTSYQYYIWGERHANDGQWLIFHGIVMEGPLQEARHEIYVWKIGETDADVVRLTFNTEKDKWPSLYVPSGTASPPNAPSNLRATAASASRIDLTWAGGGGDALGFKIERREGSGSYVEVARVGAGITAYADRNLTAATTYTYRVRAYGAGGTSDYSNTANASTPDATAGPSVAITSPLAGGADLQAGNTVTFRGMGQNLTWSYEIVADGRGPIPFGTGPSATLTVPSELKLPGEITITLAGDGGTDRQTHLIIAPPEEQSITVLSPNGGEVLTAGEVYPIRWKAVGIEDVTISYSADGGAIWTDVEFSVDVNKYTWQNYPWTVPHMPSTRCLVRVRGYFGDAPDVSDAPFEIASGPDTSPPALTLRTLEIGGVVDDVTVSAVRIAGDDFPVAGGAFLGQAVLATNRTDVTLRGIDAAGNGAVRSLQVTH